MTMGQRPRPSWPFTKDVFDEMRGEGLEVLHPQAVALFRWTPGRIDRDRVYDIVVRLDSRIYGYLEWYSDRHAGLYHADTMYSRAAVVVRSIDEVLDLMLERRQRIADRGLEETGDFVAD